MDKQQRKELILALDRHVSEVKELRTKMRYSLDKSEFWQEQAVMAIVGEAASLERRIIEASDAYKRANSDYVRCAIIEWYRFRVDGDVPDDQIKDPDIESIVYTGKDRWEIVMTTPTHGREIILYDTDTASWDQVYSAALYPAQSGGQSSGGTQSSLTEQPRRR